MVPIDTDEALAELKAGRIDAMFYVAGVPVKLFAEGVQASDDLVLVPITNKSITEFYQAAEIPAGTYPWQAEPVSTVAVKAVLVSFDFRRGDCDNVGRFARMVVRQPGLAGGQRPPEVALGRPRSAPEGMGTVRLRAQAPRRVAESRVPPGRRRPAAIP
jgi:hypothetical protein